MDEESIYRCMKYSNMVVNLIGQEVPDRNYNLHDAHVVTPRLIASAARQAGIKTMVHFSAMGATLDPPTPWTKEEAEEYAKKNIILGKSDFLITKYLGEQAVQNEFPDAVIVRPSTLFGICDNFINFYSANGRKGRCVLGTYTVYMWKKGLEAIKRPLFVSDLLDAVEVLMRDKSARGKTYEFYGPHAYLLHDLVEYISNIQRTTLKIEHGLLWRRSFTGYYSGGYKSEDGTLILHDKSNTEYLSDIPSGLPGFEECGISRKKLQSIIDLAPIFLRNTADVTNTELEQSYYAKPIPPQPVLV
ncbi:NADH dehydrogenase [ubiquinone] 1 alpha subcomplex subunit 9, mitochondrial [Lingula anatina]|uniref:NADH dehydrogenase [ubiquinone] 1 alpha subcomplex subunit 9, mitochondrial n=1 Tax=Lingula anatina TaxID=7574 RepID=A0A1S3HL63_LINAN|nr:NADH dehydrogenase [ubiquinone] 1 alpha subcomplex subunit 9, mitochondrial [Lingula anatina]|eukprot:XP_013385749.1 NADH dehydrogenase [ubiquinone] 1 alpha subcomplex subunit 9, mitochondrial [Lingula anatina]